MEIIKKIAIWTLVRKIISCSSATRNVRRLYVFHLVCLSMIIVSVISQQRVAECLYGLIVVTNR